MIDELAECHRADILAAQQLKPGEALSVAKPRAFAGRVHPLPPIRVSVPAISREMLVRCLINTITLMRMKSSAAWT